MLLPATRVAGGLFLCDESELPEIDAGEGSGHAARLRVNLWGLRRSDGVIAISESLAARLAAEIRADRLLIMPVVLDSKDFLPQSANCAVRAGVVFYAGRLNDAKDGVGTLIDAFGLVHQSRSSARLVLVGEPNISVVAEYRARVQELGLVDAVEFKGVIGRRAMLEEMGSAAVLVTARPDTPQNRVNVPTKVLEYLAAGRPVVATAVGHAKDLVSHRSTGLLVPPCDVESLAAAVLWVFDNEQEAQRMADRGRDNALSAFDYHGYTPTFGDFLARLKSRD